jgi:hypothetical protein
MEQHNNAHCSGAAVPVMGMLAALMKCEWGWLTQAVCTVNRENEVRETSLPSACQLTTPHWS